MTHSLRRYMEIVESADRELPGFANGWWVLPDGRVEECPTLGSHEATARRVLDEPCPQPVAALKARGGVRCAVYWMPTPGSPTSMAIDLDPHAVTPAARLGLLGLMQQTRALFDGYYFEHLWASQQDNRPRDYRAAVAEVRNTETVSEAVFTSAPVRLMIFGNQHIQGSVWESDEPVEIFHRPSRGELMRLLKAFGSLRAVITADDVFLADASTAAHAGMRGVLRKEGVNLEGCINAIITGPDRMTYAWSKYERESSMGLRRKWAAIQKMIAEHPVVQRMFPSGVKVIRDEWT